MRDGEFFIARKNEEKPRLPDLDECGQGWSSAFECLQNVQRFNRPGQHFFAWRQLDGRPVNLNDTSCIIAKDDGDEFILYLNSEIDAFPFREVGRVASPEELASERLRIGNELGIDPGDFTLDRNHPMV